MPHSSGSVETTRMGAVVLSRSGQARHGARQEDTVDIDAESIVPSPASPAHLWRDQAQGQGCSVSDPPAHSDSLNSQSTSPGPGRSGG